MSHGLDLALWLSGAAVCMYAFSRMLIKGGRRITLFAWGFGATGFLLRALSILGANAVIDAIGTLALLVFGIIMLSDNLYRSRSASE